MISYRMIEAAPTLYHSLKRLVAFYETGVEFSDPEEERIMRVLMKAATDALELADG